MSIKKDIIRKLSHVYVLLALLAVVLLGKILYLQTAERSQWEARAKKLTYEDITIEAHRGNILSQNNQILASSVPHYEIRMDPISNIPEQYFYDHVDSLALCLAQEFYTDSIDKKARKIASGLKEARENKNRYYFIRDEVSYEQLQRIKKFPIFERGRYEGGLIVNQYTKRKKPFKKLASRTIGRLKNSVETHTVVGLEGAYNEYLKGKDGVKLMRRISGGALMPMESANAVEPVDGKDLVSSLNMSFQSVTENALERKLQKHNAHHGTAVLMKVKTGEILAMANLADTAGNGVYNEIYNYAIGERTEPGSTFKTASLIAAMEDGYINLFDTVDTGNGLEHYYGFPIKDTKPGGWGKLSVEEILEVSSNVGVSKIITDNYRDQPGHFIDRLYNMNLGSKTGIEIKGEVSPYLKYPDDPLWSGISLPQMSIGYEALLTPLQMLTFYNAIANGGKMIRPRLGKEIKKRGEVIKKFDTEVLNPAICSKSTINKIQKMLEGVVQNGTAKNIRDAHFKIAGKTGTAQLAYDKKGYQYENNEVKYQASFIGYFPADNPKYSCIVVINSPSNSVYYGSAVAAPVFKEIADKVYARNIQLHEKLQTENSIKQNSIPYTKCGRKKELEHVLDVFNIPFQKPHKINSRHVRTTKRDKYVSFNAIPEKENSVPNVMGMGAMDALTLLERKGLNVTIEGRGMVVEQSLKPGSRIQNGKPITLEMSKN